jgi:hypothetical protein
MTALFHLDDEFHPKAVAKLSLKFDSNAQSYVHRESTTRCRGCPHDFYIDPRTSNRYINVVRVYHIKFFECIWKFRVLYCPDDVIDFGLEMGLVHLP